MLILRYLIDPFDFFFFFFPFNKLFLSMLIYMCVFQRERVDALIRVYFYPTFIL